MKSLKRFEVTLCRWNSNPRSPECEAGAVTNTLTCLLLKLLYLQLKNVVRDIISKNIMGNWSILHLDFSSSFCGLTQCNAVIHLRSIKLYRCRANCHMPAIWRAAIVFARTQSCERRLLAWSCLSVSPHATSRPPIGRILMKFDIWTFSENLQRKFKFN
jgi:hypothetical protein